MSEKEDLLRKYQGEAYPPPQKKQLATAVEEKDSSYQAAEEIKRGNRSSRFRIVLKDGTSHGYSYLNLMSWVLNASGTVLTLNLSSGVFSIEGSHLQEIERLLMDDRIRGLHEFNPQLHRLPVEEGRPVIEKITLLEHDAGI